MRTLLAALALCLSGLCFAQTANPPPYTVSPANPTVLDEITIERSDYFSNCDYASSGRVSLRMNGQTLDVTYLDSPPGCNGAVFGPIPDCSNCNLKFRLGPFPAGSYLLRLMSAHGDVIATQTITVTQSAAAGGILPVYDYGDSYWTSAESGWVLHMIATQSRQLVGVLAVYDQSNQPVWYFIAPGTWINERRYETKVFKTSGSFFGNAIYQEGPRQEVGTMIMEFASWNTTKPQLQVSYVIEGIAKSYGLTRQSF